MAFSHLLSKELGVPQEEVANRILMLMIGGCCGLVSPYAGVFVKEEVGDRKVIGKRLSIGVGVTREILPEEIGTMAMVREVAKTVKVAMGDAQITDPADVHNAQVKAPTPSQDKINDARKKGKKLVSTNADVAGAYSRGASALGVALGLDELKESDLGDGVICNDWNLYTKVVSTSARAERINCAILLMGNSKKSVSNAVIGHGVMRDALDVIGVKDALRSAGLRFSCCPEDKDLKRIEHVFLKQTAEGANSIRGRRHVMNTDFLKPHAWLIGKAVEHAVVASIVGDPMMQVSGGLEHNGPPGGGLIAIVVRVE